jgi:hypothetical protein
MTSKYLALSLAVALAALVGCSRSEPPKAAAKKSVADTFASPAQEPVTPAPPAEPTGTPLSPDQIPYVGTAPPGQVAFGPSAPGTGMDPVGDRERDQYIQDRIKDDQLKEQQARAREQAQATKAAPAKATAPSAGQKGNP